MSRRSCGAGHRGSLAYAPFPEADEALAAERTVVLPVQINGRTRLTIEVPAAARDEEVRQIAECSVDVARYTRDATVLRMIIVPGKIVNIVLK